MKLDPLSEEYRYLHTSMQLNLSLWDLAKIAVGQSVLLGACFRVVLEKDADGKTIDVDVDFYSTKVVIANAGDPIPTNEAVFEYEKLHQTESK